MKDFLKTCRIAPWLILIGLDGSGKSSVVNLLQANSALFPEVKVFHRRPGVLAPPKPGPAGGIAHYAKPAHNLWMSSLKLVVLWLDWWLGYFFVTLPARMRGELVIYDRHVLVELLVDPLRYRYGGPPWLAGLALRLAVQPSCLIFLDAPIPVLLARKREISAEKAEKIRENYHALLKPSPGVVVIDATQPLQTVFFQVKQCLICG